MATGLIRAGHEVTMLTEMPNHPEGVVHPDYRGRFWMREELDGIDVIRVWVKTTPVKTMRTRLAFYLSYMVNATLAGLLRVRGHYDLLYVSSPPLFVGGAGLALSLLRRIPMVFEVRDLWPESAVALGELSNSRLIDWATRLEERCYRRAQHIVVVTRGIRQRLLERGFPAEKIALIPNGANTDLFRFRPQAGRDVRRRLGLGDEFIAIYAGIHGIAQGLETVLEAARQLAGGSRAHFLFVGDGPCKADLVALKTSLDLSNVTMLSAQPREAIPAFLSAADVALVPLRKVDLFKNAVPSKIFDAWACECPVVLSMEGEARRVLLEAGAGIFVPPESPDALADAIAELSRAPERCREYGRRGRRFVEQHYSRQAQAAELTRLLEATVRRQS